MTDSTDAVSGASEETPDTNNLEQVRDILFGSQIRTVDRRLAQLEERIQRDIESLRTDIERQSADKDAWTRERVESLTSRLEQEEAKRVADIRAVGQDLKAAVKALEAGITELDRATAQADAELRDQVVRLGESLTEEIRALSESQSANLGKAVLAATTQRQADNRTVVDALTELALKVGARLDTATDSATDRNSES